MYILPKAPIGEYWFLIHHPHPYSPCETVRNAIIHIAHVYKHNINAHDTVYGVIYKFTRDVKFMGRRQTSMMKEFE